MNVVSIPGGEPLCSVRGPEMDRLLGLTPELLQQLTDMGASGIPVDELIWFLERRGITKPGATIALRRTRVIPVSETKMAVHLHPAYADRRESDEVFEESVLAALDSIEDHHRSAAA